jgi:regulator of CtrA degradation
MGSRGRDVTFSGLEKVKRIGSYSGLDRSGIVSISATPSAFFNKTYDETLGLLVEVRDYVVENEPVDRRRLAPVVGAKLSCEALRVTARLTQIMAWLLAQRAVHAGELSTEELVQRNEALADIDICMAADEESLIVGLPARFRELLDRSHRLYIRVARLDEMIRRQLH